MSTERSSSAETTQGGERGAERVGWPAGAFSPGECVGRYCVLERLGAGGMGVVYAAYDPKLDRKVAIKLLHANAPGRDASRGQARLQREAQALARLGHPNVVTVNDVGIHEGRVFVAMDIIAGRTLRAWLHTRPAWRDVVRVMVQAGRGLAAAHEKGLVHRDFKPDNVMIGDDERVVVMDFGLARPVGSWAGEGTPTPTRDALSEALTRRDALVGTPLYMAPEQFAGTEVTAATDQFAFCVVLWEGLHGERPFAGTTAAELAHQVGAGLVRTPPVDVSVPSALRAIAMRGLAVDPAERWPSMADLLRALARDPTARRRRLGWLAGIGLAAVATASWHMLARQAAARECRADLGPIDPAWNAARADAIGQAFAATGLAYASDTWERARVGLAEAAEGWITARDRFCERATEEDSTSTEGVRACLERHRADLLALTDLLLAPDAPIVQRTTRMVSALPPVRRCEDARVLGQTGHSGPGSPPRQARIEHERLARITARTQAGRFEEARVEAEKLIEEASRTGDQRLQAEAELRLGNALDELGRYDEARARFEAAFYRALDRDDVLAVKCAAQLVWTTGLRLGQHDEALRWQRTALALGDRVGLGDELETALVLNAAGAVYETLGEYTEALAAHERALEIRIAALGPEHHSVARSLNNIAAVHTGEGDYVLASRTLQRALEITLRVDGPTHPDAAMMMGNLGNLHRALDDPEQAQKLHERALAIQEASLDPSHPIVARTVLNLAVLHIDRRDFGTALPLLQRALRIQEEALGPEHLDVAATLNNIGTVHHFRAAYDEAIAAYERALGIRRDALGPEHERVGTLHNNIGDAHHARGDLEAAATAYAEGLRVLERALGVDHPRVGVPLAHLGALQLQRGEPASAIRMLERALALVESDPASVDLLAEVRFDLARSLGIAGSDPARARALAELALVFFEEHENPEEARRVRRWLATAPR